MLLVENKPNGLPFDFVTITSNKKNRTFEATLRVLPLAWAKLYGRMKRYQRGFEYIVVPELHKNGRIHLHMITDFVAPDEYHVHRRKRQNTRVKRAKEHGDMDSFWRNIPPLCGFGYICDQEPLAGDTAKAAGYVAKYLTKQQQLQRFPDNFKHIRASHEVPDYPRQPSTLTDFAFSAYMDARDAQGALSALAQLGYRLIDTASGEILPTSLISDE